jgi:rSAM/selenodomain-associated transferase 2
MNKMISIIIPALNEEAGIEQLLTHINRVQTGLVKEVIVADGGSTDRTRQIASAAGAVVIRCSKKGRAAQMNEGAARAGSNILFFLHADSFPPAGFDRMIYREIETGSDFGCFMLGFDDPHPLLRFYASFTVLRSALVRFGDQGLFVKSELFKKSGGFKEDLVVMEDQEMVRRLKRSGQFGLVRERVTTSARKYREVGFIKLQLIFFGIWAGYYLGADQKTLVHFYRNSTAGLQI